MGKQETKHNKKNTREKHRETENKKLLCAKSPSKTWTTNSHCQKYTRLTHSANIHLGAVRTCYWQNRVINVQQSVAQEASPVPCGRWYLEVEEQKLGRLSMHFCFGCIMGQRVQVCWWSLLWPHHRGKGFTHLVWQLKTPHCRKQEGSDSAHTDRKCSLAKQGRI